ncbi:MAG: LytTR family DNA-binding domain-containing protein [Ferruginibacter sp.]
MKLKCLIVDDEPYAHTIIQSYIADLPFLLLEGNCYSAPEAFAFLNKQVVDIIFLDIQMPKMSGMSFLRALSTKPQIIITTAHQDFAIESYEHEVCDYLLKPFSFERFVKSINRAYKICQSQNSVASISAGMNEEGSITAPQIMSIKADKRIYQVNFSEILIVESIGNYVKLHLRDKVLVTLETLKNIEQKLSPDLFIRVHKSFIVSINDIKYITGNLVTIADQEVSVGGVYRNEVLNRLKK